MLKTEDFEVANNDNNLTFGCASKGSEVNFYDNELEKQTTAELETCSAERGETFDREKKQHDRSVTWYQCQHCKYKCKTEQTLTMHLEKKHYHYEDSLTKRMGDEHGENTASWLRCDFCEFKSTSLWCLDCHKKHSHGVIDESVEHELGVEQKPNSTLNLNEFDRATDECHLIKCEIKEETNLKMDFNECDTQEAKCTKTDKHETVELYQCSLCDYKTHLKTNFSNHWKMQHEKVVWYQCDFCEFKSSSLWCLECHKKHNHGVVDEWVEHEIKAEQKPKLGILDECDGVTDDTHLIKSEIEEKTNLTMNFSEYDTQEVKCTNCVALDIKKDEFNSKIEQKPYLMLKIDACGSVIDECYQTEEKTNVTNIF